MRALVLLSLLGSGTRTSAAADEISHRREQLQKQDLRSVTAWFKKAHESLSKFHVGDKRAINDNYSAMVVTGFDDRQPTPSESWFGVFVVYGNTNQVYMVLDVGPAPQCCFPQFGRTTENLVYVDWFGDYGQYGGTRKYDYSLSKRHAPQRYGYRHFSVQSAQVREAEVSFVGVYEAPAEIGLGPSPENIALVHRTATQEWYVAGAGRSGTQQASTTSAIPERAVRAVPVLPDGSPPGTERFVKADDGLWLYVPASELAGGQQKSGVYVVNSRGSSQFYPVPLPTAEMYDRYRHRGACFRSRLGPLPAALKTPLVPTLSTVSSCGSLTASTTGRAYPELERSAASTPSLGDIKCGISRRSRRGPHRFWRLVSISCGSGSCDSRKAARTG